MATSLPWWWVGNGQWWCGLMMWQRWCLDGPRLTLKDPGRQQRAVLVITSVGWSWFRPQYLCRLQKALVWGNTIFFFFFFFFFFLIFHRARNQTQALSFIIKSCLHKYKDNKCNTLSTSQFSKSNVVY